MKASLPYKYITAVKNGKQYVVFDFRACLVSFEDNPNKSKRNHLKRIL